MKISLRWIFDHINANWSDIAIEQLVDKFNKTTAEIEGFSKISIDLSKIFLVQIKNIKKDSIVTVCQELSSEFELPARKDVLEGNCYLVKKDSDAYVWATLEDFNCYKEGLIPAVYVKEVLLEGGWKKDFEAEDYILEIDNKSITHRPDMWGHRGFAREIAAIFDLGLRPEAEFITEMAVQECETSGTDENDFTVSIENPEVGKRFAGLYMPKVQNRPSSLWMASRLMRVGSRPIDFLVDVTNYVMLDISQPMHAFDAQKLASKNVTPRFAKDGEKLILLDDAEVELTSKDYVITDGGKTPIALAGIMGGKLSAIEPGTTSIFLESANFDAATIRNSSMRVKNRTEASARFEKSLDPNQNITGIFRLLKIFQDEGVAFTPSEKIISIGKEAQPLEIVISHEFIEKRLGADIEPSFIEDVFDKLEFKFQQWGEMVELEYQVVVPTFRSTKDVQIPEDLVEEIGRFFGFENTEFILPKKETKPYDLSPVLLKRNIKKLLSFGLAMREVRNYSFYDESFISKLKWQPTEFMEVSNPVSENWKKLVTSLVPHLIKNVEDNHAKYDQLRFYEFSRIWPSGEPVEEKSLAGIFFDKKNIDFYDAKSWINSLFDLLKINVTWKKADVDEIVKNKPWFFPYQTAKLMVDDTLIGYAGKLDEAFLSPLFEGQAFVFEIDGDFILDHKREIDKFKPISKYPSVARDISMFVPLAVTVNQVKEIIKSCNESILDVFLVDFFQKNEWKDKKSLTFRFILQDYKKTLESREVDSVYESVVSALSTVGAEIR